MGKINSNISYTFEKDGRLYYAIRISDEIQYTLFYIEKSEKYGYIHVNDEIVDKIDINVIKNLISNACFVLSSRDGITPIIISNVIDRQIDLVDSTTLISSIKPIIFDGDINLDNVSTINECIEPPLKKACKLLNEKGIKTIMSSCNSEDVKNRNVKINFYRVGRGSNPPFFIGNGYAWIIIDWESLSDENKSIFVDYNSGKKQIPLSERETEILEHNCSLDNPKIPINWQMVRFFEVIDENEFSINRSAFGKLEQKSESDIYFDLNRSGLLSNCSLNNVSSNYRIIVLRYPIDELTTVGDVEKFFIKFIQQLLDQKKNQSKIDDINGQKHKNTM